MLGCAQVRNAPAKGAAARSGNWRRRCAALADDRDRLATRLNALEREMHDMSAGIKQQIEAAKADAIKTAKQAPRWPESTPPVPMTLVNVAVMVDRLSPPTASRFEPGSAAATNRAEQAPPEATASIGQTYGADLGTASTIKTLHQRWAALRNAHPHSARGQRQTKRAQRPHGIAPDRRVHTPMPRRRRSFAILPFRSTSIAAGNRLAIRRCRLSSDEPRFRSSCAS